MPARVVDASVIGAMIFEEPEADEAITLLKGNELYAPMLLAYELTNIAWKKSLRYLDRRDVLARSLETALAMDISWVDVEYPEVLRLALDTGLTAYDASYLYLARSLHAPLVTFDQRLQAASRA